MRLHDLGWNATFDAQFAVYHDAGCTPGRIALEHKHRYIAYTEQGECSAILTGKLLYASALDSLPAVGDWVALRFHDAEQATIHGVLPRHSYFVRKEAGARVRPQVVAANADTVFILVGLDGDFNLRRIERYLVAAYESGASPVLLLSKADLCHDVAARLREVAAIAPACPLHAISAWQDDGYGIVRQYLLPGHTLVLLGSSGVGKSTLLNALIGQAVARTQDVRAGDDHGRHTTTHRQLFLLPTGGLIIDTPGMRELQLWDAAEGIEESFADIEELAAQCRFADCRHQGETGCAVQQALDDGALDERRLASYRKLLREQRHIAVKQDRHAVREAERKFSQMVRSVKKQR